MLWVTHFLAMFVSVVLLGLLAYTVVVITDLEASKALMGFSSGMLGMIMGFYFNRERLEKESQEREIARRLADDTHRQYAQLRTVVDSAIRSIEEDLEE